MLLSEINPYIRYANHFIITPIDDYVCAVDYHLYYVLNGEGFITFDGTKYKIEQSCLIFITPGTSYYFENSNDVELLDFNFDFTQNFSYLRKGIVPVPEYKFDNAKIVEKVIFTDTTFFNRSFMLADILFVNKDLNEIVNELYYKKLFYMENASTYLKKVFIKLSRYFTNSLKKTQIDSVLEYIHENFMQGIDNKSLSQISGYHPVYLNQLVKQITGVTIKQYIINFRIDQAQQMLLYTDKSISEIAIDCGYDSVFYFSDAFRKKSGLSPIQFRQKYSLGH